MKMTNNIDYAITKTFQVHPDFIDELMINSQCTSINLLNFTSQYGARASVKNAQPDDFIAFVAEKLISFYSLGLHYYNNLSNNKDEIFDRTYGYYYFPAKRIIDNISNPNINIIIYLKTHPQELLEACSLITKARYSIGDTYRLGGFGLRTYLDMASYYDYQINQTTTLKLKDKIYTDLSLQNGVQNINVRRRTINRCLQDIHNGSMLKNKTNNYSLGDELYATQSMGNRPNQEDAVLIITHPDNPNFKLLAVSDGMGGVAQGDYASLETVRMLSEWFNQISADFYYYPEQLQQSLNQEINNISNHIYNAKNRGSDQIIAGATLVASVVCEERTIVSTVGDSRAYTLRGKRLDLLTRDESQVWLKYLIDKRKPTEKELDDDRFILNNNVIMRCIGEEDILPIQSYNIPNKSYDRLLLFSDGVTDLLTQQDIAVIGSNNDLSSVTKYLVSKAISENAVRQKGRDENHKNQIMAGKDNASAVMYARR